MSKTYALANGGTVEVTVKGPDDWGWADLHVRAEDGRTVATLYRSPAVARDMVAGLKEVQPQ